jgi:hypothetical protein
MTLLGNWRSNAKFEFKRATLTWTRGSKMKAVLVAMNVLRINSMIADNPTHLKLTDCFWKGEHDLELTDSEIIELVTELETLAALNDTTPLAIYDTNRSGFYLSNQTRVKFEYLIGGLRETDCLLSAVILHLLKAKGKHNE